MAKAKSILSSKVCRNCGTDKPLSDYHAMVDGAGGVRAWCKSCTTARDRSYRFKRTFDASVAEKACTRCKTIKPRAMFPKGEAPGGLHSWCRQCTSDYARNRRTRGIQPGERVARWKQQGIDATWDDFLRMSAEQGGRCAICGLTEAETGRSHQLDHDHDTGKPRGILCLTCNSGIGKLRDDPKLVQNALDYLTR